MTSSGEPEPEESSDEFLSPKQIETVEARIALKMKERNASRDEVVTTINRGVPD